MLIDQWGRQVTYLRVSVTDRCNLRCVYCMPPEGVEWQPHERIMQYEEIAQIVRVAAKEGIREVRITGGEPLVRKNLVDLIKMIAEIPGIEDLSLTTNGILLGKEAKALAKAGLKRVNVSLDTLKPALFEKITRGGKLGFVLEGFQAAEDNGLRPIKINTVILRDVNSDEIEDLAKLTINHNWHVRFIELMPIQNQKPWGEGFPAPETMYFPISEVQERLKSLGLNRIQNGVGQGPSEDYQIEGAKGKIGFISPLSKSFCERCNRLRLTADGFLRPCLLNDGEVPILDELRKGKDILPLIKKAVELKPREHQMDLDQYPKLRCMTQIGG
jgi:cyclic pyranopterin phosphate synthase